MISSMNLTKQVFNATASTYDADRSRLIPGCDAFYGCAVNLVPANATHILELGAGSGLFTQLLRDRLPQAQIHLMDFSGAMLSLAQQRLGDDSQLTYQQADYLTEPFPHRLSAVVSSLSIHHLDDEGKRAVFRKAYNALLPNGVFVNAEQVAGPTPALEERYKSLWLEQVRAAGATEQQVNESLYRQQEDRCASVEDQLLWLRQAGFADADCWYKQNRFAVLAGTRS